MGVHVYKNCAQCDVSDEYTCTGAMNKVSNCDNTSRVGDLSGNSPIILPSLGGGVLVLAVVKQDVDSTAAVYSLSGPHLQRLRFREGVIFDSNERESYNVWSG